MENKTDNEKTTPVKDNARIISRSISQQQLFAFYAIVCPVIHVYFEGRFKFAEPFRSFI